GINNARKMRLVPMNDAASAFFLQRMQASAQTDSVRWGFANQLQPVGAFHVMDAGQKVDFVAWQIPDQSTWMVTYLINDSIVMVDLTSEVGPYNVTTCTRQDSHMLIPPATSFLQSFSNLDTQNLYLRHQEAVNYIQSQSGVSISPTTQDFAQSFLAANLKTLETSQSLPLWWLRIPYWYFVRQNVRHNKPIATLYPTVPRVNEIQR
ncbi:MAG: hypothetical protein AAFN70_01735, partial [Planctomycetota bacterium]